MQQTMLDASSTAAPPDDTHGARVRLRILEMGLRLWLVDPAIVSARRIAGELGMTHGNVLHHFKHSAGLMDALAFHAVKQGEARIIAQLIVKKHKAAAHLSEAQRLHYLQLSAG